MGSYDLKRLSNHKNNATAIVKQSCPRSYWEASLSASDKKHAMSIIKKHDPKNFILKRQSLEETFNTMYGDPTHKLLDTFTREPINA